MTFSFEYFFFVQINVCVFSTISLERGDAKLHQAVVNRPNHQEQYLKWIIKRLWIMNRHAFELRHVLLRDYWRFTKHAYFQFIRDPRLLLTVCNCQSSWLIF